MACSAHVRDLQPAHTTPARARCAALRFGALDWAAPPIILLGLLVLRLQHQALEWVPCSATFDLFVRGGRLARLIRRPSRCVGPARPCRYEYVCAALLAFRPACLWGYSSRAAEVGLGRCRDRNGCRARAGYSFRLTSDGRGGVREPREVWGWLVGEFDAYTKVIRNCWRLLDEGCMQSLCCPEPTEIGS